MRTADRRVDRGETGLELDIASQKRESEIGDLHHLQAARQLEPRRRIDKQKIGRLDVAVDDLGRGGMRKSRRSLSDQAPGGRLGERPRSPPTLDVDPVDQLHHEIEPSVRRPKSKAATIFGCRSLATAKASCSKRARAVWILRLGDKIVLMATTRSRLFCRAETRPPSRPGRSIRESRSRGRPRAGAAVSRRCRPARRRAVPGAAPVGRERFGGLALVVFIRRRIVQKRRRHAIERNRRRSCSDGPCGHQPRSSARFLSSAYPTASG